MSIKLIARSKLATGHKRRRGTPDRRAAYLPALKSSTSIRLTIAAMFVST
jgi:hypothetical protein